MAEKNALGVVELSSISRGYLVQDAMLKSSDVEKLISRTICSGKYFIAVRGDVAEWPGELFSEGLLFRQV